MPIVKLGATTSTNDFLKELAVNQSLENFTVVTAESQTQGRGQMGAKWISESGKNLIMSVLVNNGIPDINHIFDLNVGTTLAVFDVLLSLGTPQLSIKWPNDIMSGSKKVGGILIENSIRSNGDIISILGIGINVNQTDFNLLPNASSLCVVINKEIDRDALLDSLLVELKLSINRIGVNHSKSWDNYYAKLFRKSIPSVFEDRSGVRFMGMISNVLRNGRLQVQMEDGTEKTFDIKEIKMLF